MSQFKSASIRLRAFDFDERLARVRDYCEDHLSQKITLANAADVAGLEYTYFSSYFHNAVGVRFGDWLRYRRVLKAQELIRRTRNPISTVAGECGFQNLRTFQRAFRRVTDMTPREYRREIHLGHASYGGPGALPGLNMLLQRRTSD